MRYFYGQEQCKIDGNGRLKIPPRFVKLFQDEGDSRIVLHCLPEGALGIYPVAVWEQMRRSGAQTSQNAVDSVVSRRELRRFGAFTEFQQITRQGRLTIPQGFRSATELNVDADVQLIGVEIGLEAWSLEKWNRESQLINSHEMAKFQNEMDADLRGEGE